MCCAAALYLNAAVPVPCVPAKTLVLCFVTQPVINPCLCAKQHSAVQCVSAGQLCLTVWCITV